MLYNPDWQTPSLVGFIAWLETKPAHKRYRYIFPSECVCGRYAQEALGLKPCTQAWNDKRWSLAIVPLEEIAHGKPHTYGACLERAKAIQQIGELP